MGISEASKLLIDVLLVEDNPGDARLIKDTLHARNPSVRLHIACDGVEAMAFLLQQGEHFLAPRPSLILLDLNLPRLTGREVLSRIKGDEVLKTIPVIILTTSDSETDILNSYELQANCYLSKPVLLDDFESVVNGIDDFWLTQVKLPKSKRSGR